MNINMQWLDSIDVDLTLKEIRDCSDEPWTMRALAGASVGTNVRTAHEEAAELLEILDHMAVGFKSAKVRLARLLGAPGNDYQRCLFYSLAGRTPLETLVSLRWLVGALKARRRLVEFIDQEGLDFSKEPNPYLYDESDGPLGVFPEEYRLSDQWQWVFETTQDAIKFNRRP